MTTPTPKTPTPYEAMRKRAEDAEARGSVVSFTGREVLPLLRSHADIVATLVKLTDELELHGMCDGCEALVREARALLERVRAG